MQSRIRLLEPRRPPPFCAQVKQGYTCAHFHPDGLLVGMGTADCEQWRWTSQWQLCGMSHTYSIMLVRQEMVRGCTIKRRSEYNTKAFPNTICSTAYKIGVGGCGAPPIGFAPEAREG
eukprot:gene8837-biopygen9144